MFNSYTPLVPEYQKRTRRCSFCKSPTLLAFKLKCQCPIIIEMRLLRWLDFWFNKKAVLHINFDNFFFIKTFIISADLLRRPKVYFLFYFYININEILQVSWNCSVYKENSKLKYFICFIKQTKLLIFQKNYKQFYVEIFIRHINFI